MLLTSNRFPTNFKPFDKNYKKTHYMSLNIKSVVIVQEGDGGDSGNVRRDAAPQKSPSFYFSPFLPKKTQNIINCDKNRNVVIVFKMTSKPSFGERNITNENLILRNLLKFRTSFSDDRKYDGKRTASRVVKVVAVLVSSRTQLLYR